MMDIESALKNHANLKKLLNQAIEDLDGMVFLEVGRRLLDNEIKDCRAARRVLDSGLLNDVMEYKLRKAASESEKRIAMYKKYLANIEVYFPPVNLNVVKK